MLLGNNNSQIEINYVSATKFLDLLLFFNEGILLHFQTLFKSNKILIFVDNSYFFDFYTF